MFKTYSIMLPILGISIACGELGDSNSKSEDVQAGKVTVTQGLILKPPRAGEIDNTQKTAMVFYIADTKETNFPLAVAYEMRQLREACHSQNTAVNWVAYVNSLFVAKREYFKCNAGKYSIEKFTDKNLELKLAAIKDPKFDPMLKNKKDERTKLFDPKLALEHPSELNTIYAEAPFIHPEIMKDIFAFTWSEIFSPEQFASAVITKGHGSSTNALTALTPAQVKRKIEEQASALAKLPNLAKLNTISILSHLPLEIMNDIHRLGLGQMSRRSKYQLDVYSRIYKKAGTAALNESNAASGLNEAITGLNEAIPGLNEAIPGLNEAIPGLNEAIPGLNEAIIGLNPQSGGLGAGEFGLQSANVFGTKRNKYFYALKSSYKPKQNPNILFQFVESCDAKTDENTIDILATTILRPRMLYTSQGGLWYRSLDWNNIYYKWLEGKQTTPQAMQTILEQESLKIKNYRYE